MCRLVGRTRIATIEPMNSILRQHDLQRPSRFGYLMGLYGSNYWQLTRLFGPRGLAPGRYRSQGQALGFPLFHSARAGQEANDRAWRKGQRRKYEWSRPRGLDQDDRREIARRMAPPIKWSRWLLRYLGIFLFFLTVAVVYVAAA